MTVSLRPLPGNPEENSFICLPSETILSLPLASLPSNCSFAPLPSTFFERHAEFGVSHLYPLFLSSVIDLSPNVTRRRDSWSLSCFHSLSDTKYYLRIVVDTCDDNSLAWLDLAVDRLSDEPKLLLSGLEKCVELVGIFMDSLSVSRLYTCELVQSTSQTLPAFLDGLGTIEKSGYLRSEFCMDSFLGTKGVRLDSVLLSIRRNED